MLSVMSHEPSLMKVPVPAGNFSYLFGEISRSSKGNFGGNFLQYRAVKGGDVKELLESSDEKH